MSTLPDKFQFRVARIPGFTHTATKNAWGDYEVKWARGYAEHLGTIPVKTFYDYSVNGMVERGDWIVVDEQKAEKEDAKAPVKEALPDVFHFVLTDSSDATVFKATKGDNSYVVSWTEPSGKDGQTTYPLQMVQNIVDENVWTIVDEPLPDEFCFKIGLTGDVYQMTKVSEGVYNVVLYKERAWADALTSDWPLDEIVANLKGGLWKMCEAPTLTAEQKRLNKELNEQIAALTSSVRISEQAEEHQKRLQANYKERIDVLKAKLVEGQ